MIDLKAALKNPPSGFRAPVSRGLAAGAVVQRDEGFGVIPGCAVITVGEALGHGLWIDQEFVDQVSAAMLAEAGGLKCRFTHPGLSSDGLGKFLGRFHGVQASGNVARGDLHLSKLSHATPSGDLGKYVMDLAEEDPKAFGTSIVFDRDWEAEEVFMTENGAIWDCECGWVGFRSPDPLNVKNLPHCRLGNLQAVDVVDSPAANPGGMFSRGQDAPQAAESLLSYCLGLSDEMPKQNFFDVDPERLTGFVQRFMSRHGLSVVKNEGSEMTEGKSEGETPIDPKKPAPGDSGEVPPGEEMAPEGADPVPAKPEDGAECDPEETPALSARRYMETFGRERGALYFADGLTFEQAQAEFAKESRKENELLAKENAELREKLSAASGLGAPIPAGGNDSPSVKYGGRLTSGLGAFAAGLKIPGRG